MKIRIYGKTKAKKRMKESVEKGRCVYAFTFPIICELKRQTFFFSLLPFRLLLLSCILALLEETAEIPIIQSASL